MMKVNRLAAQQLMLAAQLIDASKTGACIVLDRIGDELLNADDPNWPASYSANLLAKKTLRRLGPNRIPEHGYWWGKPYACSLELHNARVLGVLFAREMVLSEDA